MAEETTTSAKVQAKRQRAQLLVEVTEVEKTLRNAIQSNAPHQSIETELEKLHRAFTKFKGSHLECIAVLNDTDISAKLAADFEHARMSYEKCAEETSEHLKQGSPDEQSPDPPTGGTDLTQLFAQMQKQMTKAFEHHIQKQREHAEASQQKMHQEIQQQIKELRQEFASTNTQNSETEEQNSQYSSTHSETQNFTSAPSAPANVLSGTPTAPQTSTPVSTEEVLLKIASTLQYVQRNSTLPKQELLTFSGNPLDYTKFIHNFETFIASQFLDDSEKLQYLVQQCRGEARRRIDDYITVRPASEGYKQALNMLKTDYGRPYVISRAYVDQLTKGNPIRGNDAEALRSLAVDMKKCELNLSQTGFSSDIDNSENIKRIVHRLPNYMRTRWTEVAFGINESGREPNFKDLVKFVDERSRVASSMYGMDYAQDKRKQRPNSHKESTKPRTTTLSTHASKGTRKNCAYCDSSCNGVSNCHAFSELKLTDRVSAVKRLRLCINCLWSNHFVSECKYAPQCKEPNCGKKHHRLLHGWTPKKQVEKSVETSVSAATAGGSKKTAFLGIIPVRVEGRGGRVVETYALLDNGSQQSFCSEELLLKLGIKRKAINYTVTTLTSQKQRYRGREANLTVKSLSGSNTAHLSGVWTVKNLAISTRLAAKPSDIKGYAHLADLDIPEIEDCDVALLIGGDSEAQIPIEVRSSGIAGEPYAERNLLGWVVRGPSNKQQSKAIHVNFLQTGTLQENLEKMWRTDFSERCDTDEVGWSVDDKRAAKIMSDTISIDDGHYKLALPWQDKTFVPPNNKVQAYARLNQLKRRLERDPELHAKYTEQMNQYLDKGHAEAAPLSKKHDRTWYLPHQPVTNPNKPDKVRIVFDGASKFQGTSLNDQLLQGPDYFNSLIGILLRFRQGHVAIAGDIESMFHQVKVADEDRNALRFLWWENGDLTKSPNEYRMAVHIFGAKSSPSCTTFALRKTANDNKSKYSEITVNSVSKSFYVDDFLKSLDDEGAVVDLARELRQLLKCGGFRLTKFLSNRQNVINSIPASERAASVQNASLCDEQPNERALGVRWDVHDDKLTYDAKVPDKPVTRRGILAAVSSLFDPLGLAAPVTLKAKAVLQELCRMQLSWDSEIPESERIKWHNWLKALPSLRAVRIPRCYKPIGFGKVIDIQLHIFCDASENGYGACAYLRFTNQHGAVCVSLAFGKSRLAPLKQVSIPRLELTAAVLASRLCAQIHREVEFEISQTILWTDSMIALSYIKNKSRRFKVFVANRLAIIHENTKESQWRHVPTQSNPADIASRGLDPDDKTKLNVWLNGPVFLQQGEENWPAVINIPLVPEQDTETKKASVNAIAEHDDSINKLFMKFSDWHKLKRATCWILRFQKYCLQRYLKRRVEVRNTELSVEEISAASRSVISYVQQQCFTDEMDKLQVRKPVSKDSRLVSLCPFYEHGLLRVGG